MIVDFTHNGDRRQIHTKDIAGNGWYQGQVVLEPGATDVSVSFKVRGGITFAVPDEKPYPSGDSLQVEYELRGPSLHRNVDKVVRVGSTATEEQRVENWLRQHGFKGVNEKKKEWPWFFPWFFTFPLHTAVKHKDVEMIQLLLRFGAETPKDLAEDDKAVLDNIRSRVQLEQKKNETKTKQT